MIRELFWLESVQIYKTFNGNQNRLLCLLVFKMIGEVNVNFTYKVGNMFFPVIAHR